jgi:hypothetical protein
MASTVRFGAVYGIGVYGVDQYGLTSVTHVPDGVQAVATSDSGVVIIGDANHVVVGVTMGAAISSVGVVGVAVTSVAGVVSTAVVGALSVTGDATLLLSGVAASGAVGNLPFQQKLY